MAIAHLTGNDTSIVNGRILNDFGKGNIVEITFNDNMVEVSVGKDGNSLYSENTSGRMGEVKYKMLAGSEDAKFFNSLYLEMQRDLPTFPTLTSSHSKRLGGGSGNTSSVIYTGSGGVFTKGFDMIESTDGDIEEAQVIVTVVYTSLVRTS